MQSMVMPLAPLEVDLAYVAALRGRMRQLRRKDLRVLLLTNSLKKYQEQLVVSFFDRAPLSACDWHCADNADRTIAKLRFNARRITREAAMRGRYDRVVAFDCNRELLTFSAIHGCPAILIGKLRQEHGEESRASLGRLPGPVLLYLTQGSMTTPAALDAFFGVNAWRRVDGIDFPPGVPLQCLIPRVSRFDAFVPGGGDRDYGFLYRHRELLPRTVLVSNSDSANVTPEARAALDRMRECEQFHLLPRLRPERYLRLLLDSRLVIVRMGGEAYGDYTSIADALWYGKPVLVNRVRSTVHLEGRVIFYEDAVDLATSLRLLANEEHYRATSARVREATRAKHDLFSLLLRVFEEL